MKKIFYEKVGRRYRPVKEYDNDLLDAFPKGNHLLMVYPGGASRRYNIDPNYAAMIAAGRVAEDVISRALVKAGEIRMRDRNRALTPSQKAAWENLIKEFGESARQLEWPSAREISEAAIKSLVEEADQLMKHDAVRAAYEQFLIIAELTKQTEDK